MNSSSLNALEAAGAGPQDAFAIMNRVFVSEVDTQPASGESAPEDAPIPEPTDLSATNSVSNPMGWQVYLRQFDREEFPQFWDAYVHDATSDVVDPSLIEDEEEWSKCAHAELRRMVSDFLTGHAAELHDSAVVMLVRQTNTDGSWEWQYIAVTDDA